MLRTSGLIQRTVANGNYAVRRRSIGLVAVMGAVLMVLLTAACGSSAEPVAAAAASAPTIATAPTVPPTSLPATAVPEPTPIPTPEYVPGPREANFADGQFNVHFLYRSDPEVAALIDIVDVESVIGPVLERIATSIELPIQKVLIKGPVYSRLNETNAAKLEREGYVFRFSQPTFAIDLSLNPNGAMGMEDMWRTIVPHEFADWTYFYARFQDANGLYVSNLLGWLVSTGLGMAYQQELFPDHEERMRELRPDYSAVIYDLTPEAESEIWAAAKPDLDDSRVRSGALARFFDIHNGGTDEFPTGVGRAIGLRIVQAYMENNPGATASSLLRVPTEEIFEGSGYNP